MSFLPMLAQHDAGGPVFAVFMVVWLGLSILMIASMWTIHTKAGKPGWTSLVPIYNVIVLLEIAGKPLWWIILLFIPLVNIAIVILIFIGLARSFGKSDAFGLGLFFLNIIFLPMLAFGDAEYQGN